MAIEDLLKYIVVGVLIGGLGLVVARWLGAFSVSNSPGGAQAINQPAGLSLLAQKGKVLFDANCADCHGQSGVGTDHGPPFMNDIYNPGITRTRPSLSPPKREFVHITGILATCRLSRA